MIARLRRIDAAGTGDDRGIGLVELIVSMMITAIALAIIGTLFVTVAKTTSDSNATRTATGTAANAMNEVSRVIRSAAQTPNPTVVGANGASTANPAIVSGSANALTTIAWIDANSASPVPTQVAFSLSSTNQLLESRTTGVLANGAWTFPGTPVQRTLADALTASSDPIFTYYDSTGAVVQPTPSLTAAQLLLVTSVKVVVSVPNRLYGGTAPLVLTNTVGMPNLALNGGGS